MTLNIIFAFLAALLGIVSCKPYPDVPDYSIQGAIAVYIPATGKDFQIKTQNHDVRIKSFRISCQSDRWNASPNKAASWKGWTGVIVYDVGTCASHSSPNKKCGSMRNGYVLIFDSDTIKHLPGSFHSKAVQHYFGETPEQLWKKYGMKFGGFSVKTPHHANPNLKGSPGFNSGTFNAAIGNGVGWSDGQRDMNAAEAAFIFMIVEEWKKKGPAITMSYDDTINFFNRNCKEILDAFKTAKVTKLADKWEKDYCDGKNIVNKSARKPFVPKQKYRHLLNMNGFRFHG